MSRQSDEIVAVQARIVRAIRQATGLHEQFALEIAKTVLETLADDFRGERLYFAKRLPVTAEQLRKEAVHSTREQICKRHCISRRTYYRLLKQD